MKSLAAALNASIAACESICTLIRITLSTGQLITLADHDADVTLGGVVYVSSLAFEVSSVAVKTGTQNSSLELSLLMDPTCIDRQMILSGALDRAKCEVFLVDYANPANGAALYYAGRVSQMSFVDDISAVLQITSLLDQNLLAAAEQYSYNCTADLGDARCKVNIAAKSKTFTVTSALNSQAFTTDLSDADKFWTAGLVEFTDGANANYAVEIGSYVKSQGAIVTKLPLSYAIAVGDTGTVYPGCDKTPATCLDVYGNIANYRGIPLGIDPSLAGQATALTGDNSLPPDEQPPGTIGFLNTLDGSFAWIAPSTLPPLPDDTQVPAGVNIIDQYGNTTYGTWLSLTSRQFPTYPKDYDPLGASASLFGASAGSGVQPGGNVVTVSVYLTADIGYAQPSDDATAYGLKFTFDGYIYAYQSNINNDTLSVTSS